MIRTIGLRKQYGKLVAVDDVALEVRRGETFGLLGPNGAGKTTTIHMLVGALRPDAGHVEVNGRRDPTQPAVRRDIGIAPQKLSLYEELSCIENLRFFARLHGVSAPDIPARIEWALDFARLGDRRKDRVCTYSGGMQRRLNIAVALLHDPPLLLFDEPTVGVDPQSRNHIFQNIEALRAEGRTVIYTTHYMEEAERLCDRVGIMDHGRLLAVDTVANLVGAHGGASLVTAELDRPPEPTVDLPGTLDGTTLRIETQRPFDEVGALASSGLRIRTLHIERPNLETVFLNLTGRSLRD